MGMIIRTGHIADIFFFHSIDVSIEFSSCHINKVNNEFPTLALNAMSFLKKKLKKSVILYF